MEVYSTKDFTGSNSNSEEKLLPYIIRLVPNFITLAVFIIFTVNIFSLAGQIKNPKKPKELSPAEKENLEYTLDVKYPSRKDVIYPLPYSFNMPINTYAKSSILIDMNTGAILWEKNADVKIPPASMTKLVEMYVVFEAVNNGEVSLDDIVPLPKESWAVNMPPDSSLMFLARGQTVTLRKLLEGLSIASGNDASHAVAYYIAGDMESFVERMNKVILDMGLKNTVFVESSGYSEKNITTARDFAIFSRNYINKFPFALNEFHSLEKLEWPPENPIIQKNTNKLLGVLEGCDGLKTGFINESGFNLALTAERNGRRYLSITMNGPGSSTAEGNTYRVKDGTLLMETAFTYFTQYRPEVPHSYTVAVLNSKEKSVSLVPAKNEFLTIPRTNTELTINAKIPRYLEGTINCAKQYGTITYMQGNRTLYEIPLVADKESLSKKRASVLISKIVKKLFL